MIRHMITIKKVRNDLMNDSINPTSRFSQIILLGESAVSIAVNLNRFQNRYFQVKI